MMALYFLPKSMVVIVIVAATCASVTSSIHDSNEQLLERTNDESSQNSQEKAHSEIGYATKLSSLVRNGSTTAKQEKKIIHRLIGGHVKLHTKVAAEAKDQRENISAATWDDGLMMSAAGNGKEKTSVTRRDDDDEEKKTLSQQVKEGKYGLIQNEIYPTPPKRPGIISYLSNPEVPKDTAKNLGGLDEEEIWLAENHLLVLRGGNFPDHGAKPESNGGKWAPIDDYKAPERQVKIPARPNVPPPFPVQLTEGGPVQIIRANGSASIVNDTADYDEYANYPEGFFPGEAPFYPFPSNTSNPSKLEYPENSTESNESYLPPSPGKGGTIGPFYPALPPGAVFLPPPNNQSDYEDEDQSIYYPPPYSFFYPQNNATAIPPGPLVPGIILPPPPNFFAPLESDRTSTTKSKYEKQTTTTVSPEKTTTYTPRRKTVTKPYKVRFSTTTPTTQTYVTATNPTTRIQSQTVKTIGKTKSRHYGVTSSPIRVTPTVPISTQRYIETTTSKPSKPTTISQSDYYDVQTEVENHLVDLGEPQGGQWSAIVGSTSVPLLAYYATTISPSERTRSTDEITPVNAKATIPSKNQASYYYYEETANEEPIGTTTASPPVYYKTSTESPYYNVEPITSQRQPKKQYYSVETIPSQQTANDYDIKLSSLVKVGPDYNEFSDVEPVSSPIKYNVERPRSQSPHALGQNSQRYYQPISLNAPATIRPYYTTQRPRFYYQNPPNQQYDYRAEQELKPNPVYQYSYEATDYAKERQRPNYHQELQQGYNDYQPTSTNGQYYDYETRPVEKLPKSPRNPYLAHRPSYPTATPRPHANTSPNPQHAYYTKQDEQLLDDVTKQYFTIFGKKLPETVLPSTTPLYRVPSSTTETPISHNVNTYVSNRYNNALQPPQRFKPPKVKVHYGDQTQRPYSLEGDTLVNYKNPLPEINPDAEFIPVNKPRRYPNPPISLANDIAVNYRDPRPPINPDAEFIDPVQGQGNQGTRSGSYFAYQLPGNGGHFYFLTPQAIAQRQDINGGYIYPKPNVPRFIRRRRGPSEG
ncbi:uncharacterized protein LOC105685882 isoform X2 [Athalia rosae]|uniref:uncharacterized protein LOC105685882 isoform X2 n=1 Tax=Athalia rosae TaxID=37344 RepID=UPI002033A232|nr:uncharacterized protein LOC105685882 isoform X2 [Athalia rosae]